MIRNLYWRLYWWRQGRKFRREIRRMHSVCRQVKIRKESP